MVRCADNSLYTGWTKDVKARVDAHNRGRGAKYTRARRPVVLVWYEEYETEHEARAMECKIKKWPKKKKEEWVLQQGR